MKKLLTTQQKNAASFLSAHTTNVTDKNLTTRSYLNDLNAEAFQTLLEGQVPGLWYKFLIIQEILLKDKLMIFLNLLLET